MLSLSFFYNLSHTPSSVPLLPPLLDETETRRRRGRRGRPGRDRRSRRPPVTRQRGTAVFSPPPPRLVGPGTRARRGVPVGKGLPVAPCVGALRGLCPSSKNFIVIVYTPPPECVLRVVCEGGGQRLSLRRGDCSRPGSWAPPGAPRVAVSLGSAALASLSGRSHDRGRRGQPEEELQLEEGPRERAFRGWEQCRA